MTDLVDIDVAILTGGKGTRLKAVLPGLPKGLAPVMGRPFLTFLLDRLAGFGVTRTILCTGYLGERIQATLGKTYAGIQLAYSRESLPLDTGGALRLSLPLLRHETIMVLNGDSYVHADLMAFRSWFQRSNAPAAVLLAQMADPSRYGRVELGDGDDILSFMEKNGQLNPGWVNAGIYLLDKRVIDAIKPGVRVSLERQILVSMVGYGLKAYRTQAELMDIGTPDSLKRAELFLRKYLPNMYHI